MFLFLLFANSLISQIPTDYSVKVFDTGTQQALYAGNSVISENFAPKRRTICTTHKNNFPGSVLFHINGVRKRLENYGPFCIGGDGGANHRYPWLIGEGSYQLVVRAYSGKNGTGTLLKKRTIQLRSTPITTPVTPVPPSPPMTPPTTPITPIAPIVINPIIPSLDAIQVGASEVWMSRAERSALGLTKMGDGTIGFAKIGDGFQIFAPMASGYFLGGSAIDPANYSAYTQRISATNLGNVSTWRRENDPNPLHKSNLANAFDRNYGAGGAVSYDAAQNLLLHVYHGEFWLNGAQSWLPFYAGLGLAFSRDQGRSFTKLGQIIAPRIPRAQRCPYDISVETGGGTLLNKGDGYFYLFYTDVQWVQEWGACVLDHAVARASVSDVMAAVQAGRVPSGELFKKYYHGTFTEPGVLNLQQPELGGGRYTEIIERSSQYGNFPSVMYSAHTRSFVMTHSLGNRGGIGIRFSPDLLRWSAVKIITPSSDAYYSTLVNMDGGDPQVLGKEFYVVFLDPYFRDWDQAEIRRVKVTLP